MVNRAVILVVLFAWICATTVAQERCDNINPGVTYCGQFCCPQDDSPDLVNCCPDREERMCCGNDTMVDRNFCGGDLRECPTSLPPDEVYDGTDQLRNQCCLYFRSGCCSANENQTLDLLFKLAIGLGVGLFALLLIIGILVFCICCCVCCD